MKMSISIFVLSIAFQINIHAQNYQKGHLIGVWELVEKRDSGGLSDLFDSLDVEIELDIPTTVENDEIPAGNTDTKSSKLIIQVQFHSDGKFDLYASGDKVETGLYWFRQDKLFFGGQLYRIIHLSDDKLVMVYDYNIYNSTSTYYYKMSSLIQTPTQN